MPIPEPVFDRRSYRDILNEALARIPAHTPEWTNFNDSDPGVTLLQLFAFMSESIIYRANLIPERNRRKFLRLLGVPMRPAAPAQGLVAFEHGAGSAVSTLASERVLYAGGLPFRTRNGLDVLPLTAQLYYKRPLPPAQVADVERIYAQLYASQLQEGEVAEYYQTERLVLPAAGNLLPQLDIGTETVDGSLWVALLAAPQQDIHALRTQLAGKTLSLGILPAVSQEGAVIHPRGGSRASDATLVYEMPDTKSGEPRYRRLAPTQEVDLLTTPGVVELRLPEADGLDYWNALDPLEAGVGDYPPSLEDTDLQDRLVTWLRIRSPEAFGSEGGSRQVHVPLSWVGINAARVVQEALVAAEALPVGTGEPDQGATLANTPVVLERLEIRVNGELWTRIDDLAAAGAEVPAQSPRLAAREVISAPPVNVYTADRESGEIRFGDGLHGRRPPRGAAVQATYTFGGGASGNLGIGAINKGAPSGLRVRNPVPTWGGSEGESVADAERRIPAHLRHRERLVTQEDYLDIVRNTPGVDLGRVEVLPLLHPELPAQASDGVVTVLVIPRTDPVQPEAPRPDRLFLGNICAHLQPRRLLTTELHVVGPVYVPIWMAVGLEVVPGEAEGPVREAVRRALLDFVSPLRGGFGGGGWPLARSVEPAELLAAAARVPGVARINELLLGDTGGGTPRVALEGLELPRVMAVEVSGGSAVSIAELQGRQPVVDETGLPVRRPLPVIPEEC